MGTTRLDYCGWGAKQGSKVRSWKNRYFVLRGCELVYYSGTRNDGSGIGIGEKGRLQVVNVEYLPDLKNGLLIYGKERNLKMTTSSAQESQLLYHKIKKVMEESEKRRQLVTEKTPKKAIGNDRSDIRNSLQMETQGDLVAVDRQHSTIECEGWVEKFGQRSKVWKKRYMSLENGMLEYRKGPMEQLLAEVKVKNVRYSSKYSNAFEIEFGSNELQNDSDIICIRTESIQDLNKWMGALCDIIGKPQLHSAEWSSLSPTKKRQIKRQPLPFSRHLSLHQDDDNYRPPFNGTRPLANSDADCYSSALIATAGNRTKRGWLYEQGSEMSSWMLRYFILVGNTLHRYQHVNGTSETLGHVANVVRNNEPTGSLNVQFDDGSTLNVYGETKADTDAWYAALREAVWNATENAMKRDFAAKQENEEIQGDNSFHGWLLKKGQNFKTWKRRYFVLKRSHLVYSAFAGSEVLGSGVVFDVSVGDLRPFCLNVRFQNGRLLHVVAPTQDSFLKWFDVLREASNLVESFLLQSKEKVVVGEEFDNDVGDNMTDVDVEFTAENVSESELTLRDCEGASLWIAAMHNKPEYDALSSSSSSEQYDESILEADSVSQARESSLIIPNESQGCVGWLKKEGKNIRSWKLRYFTLYGSKLSYYKSEKGSLLRSVNVVDVAVHPSISRGLTISTVGGRKLIVQAESTDQYDRWFDSIRKAVSGENDRTSAVTAPIMSTIMDNGSSEDLKGSVSHSGWLLKEGQRFKTWKRRFFTLKNSALIYYSEIGGVARGHGMVKGAHQDDTKSNTLTIVFCSDKIMRVTATSDADMKSWFRVLSQVSSLSSRTIDVSDDSNDIVDSEGEDGDEESGARIDRFNSNDYLNDSISNDTLMRLRDEEGKATILESCDGTFISSRTFKGELTFDIEEEKEDLALTITGEDYYRQLVAEDVRVQEQRLAEKLATKEPPITGCVPCCVVM